MSSLLLSSTSSSKSPEEQYTYEPELTIDPARLTASHPSTTSLEYNQFFSPFSHISSSYDTSGTHSYIDQTTPGVFTETSGFSVSDLAEIDEFLGVNFDEDRTNEAETPASSTEQTSGFESSSDSKSDRDSSPLDRAHATASTSKTGLAYPSHTPGVEPTHQNDYNPIMVGNSPYNNSQSTEEFPSLNEPLPTTMTSDYPVSQTNLESLNTLQPPYQVLSPRVTVSHWDGTDDGHSIDPLSQAVESVSDIHPRDDDGRWLRDEHAGPGGLNPNIRDNAEVSSINDLSKKRHLDAKKEGIETWRSRSASVGAPDLAPNHSYFSFEVPVDLRPRARSTGMYTPQSSSAQQPAAIPMFGLGVLNPNDDPVPTPEDVYEPPNNNITASFEETENRLKENRLYYSSTAPVTGLSGKEDHTITHSMSQGHSLWSDAPMHPQISRTNYMPRTATEAMQKLERIYNDTDSQLSRVATWGTRRKSAPSVMSDAEMVTSGSLFKMLTIGRSKNTKNDGIKIFQRKKNDNNKKRNFESRDPNEPSPLRKEARNLSGGLVPPPRTSSWSRKNPTPSLNTALATMGASAAAVGGGHARSDSLSAASNVSPKSPLDAVTRFISRARSRSDLRRQSSHDDTAPVGLAEMWKTTGGPPVPNLTAQPSEPEIPSDPVEPAQHSEDDDEGDDDHAYGFDSRAAPMRIPHDATRDGFSNHIRDLNPNMANDYLIERIIQHQTLRYKNLCSSKVKHLKDIRTRNCASRERCSAMPGHNASPNVPSKPPGIAGDYHGLDDNSSGEEGLFHEESFPPGVPMPPVTHLPADFECQLCYKVKKLQKPSDWTKHVHEDLMPFTCTYPDCKDSKPFKRKADWVRHENEKHRHLEWYKCTINDCNHRCYRKDNFLQHLVREHKLPEPKHKTKTAIKRSQGDEDEVWILMARCHHETPRKPQEEPCKFCGAELTSWKKLTVHLAKHLEEISLPVLRLVDQRPVDFETIISPIEMRPQNLATTPMMKSDSNTSAPFNVNEYSPETFTSDVSYTDPLYQTQGMIHSNLRLSPHPHPHPHQSTSYTMQPQYPLVYTDVQQRAFTDFARQQLPSQPLPSQQFMYAQPSTTYVPPATSTFQPQNLPANVHHRNWLQNQNQNQAQNQAQGGAAFDPFNPSGAPFNPGMAQGPGQNQGSGHFGFGYPSE